MFMEIDKVMLCSLSLTKLELNLKCKMLSLNGFAIHLFIHKLGLIVNDFESTMDELTCLWSSNIYE